MGKVSVTIPFKPHTHQWAIVNLLKRFSVLVCHRRFGKTVLSVNLLVKDACSPKLERWRGAYMAPLYRQAKAVAWDYLQYYTRDIPSMKYYQQELRADFPNGSRVMLLGADNPDTLRGIYLDAAVLDEYAQMSPRTWGEVIRPALADRKGWGIFIGTPMGHNHFYDLHKHAMGNEAWADVIYRASETNILDPEELKAAQEDMTPEEYAQEFECSFEAAIVGAYYGTYIAQAEQDGRICSVPYDPIMPVHTTWDLGVGDSMAIWFFQLSPGGEIRWIDYEEGSGEGLEHYFGMLKGKKYLYGEHIAPPDIKVREMTFGARSRWDFAASHGIKFRVVASVSIDEGINAVRSILPRSWFDEEKTRRGVDCLRQYRRELNRKLMRFGDRPLHDWTSHASDSIRYGALGIDAISDIKTLKPPRTPSYAVGEHGWML